MQKDYELYSTATMGKRSLVSRLCRVTFSTTVTATEVIFSVVGTQGVTSPATMDYPLATTNSTTYRCG